MIKIYYELEGKYYTFKTFLYDEFFIASGTGKRCRLFAAARAGGDGPQTGGLSKQRSPDHGSG